jgi:hypothetical protein
LAVFYLVAHHGQALRSAERLVQHLVQHLEIAVPAPRRDADHAPAPVVEAVPLHRHLHLVLPLVPLSIAAELTSVSDKLLWIEYLTLGGTADLEAFREHLHQPDPGAPDHEVVLEALEAVLADEDVPVRVR